MIDIRCRHMEPDRKVGQIMLRLFHCLPRTLEFQKPVFENIRSPTQCGGLEVVILLSLVVISDCMSLVMCTVYQVGIYVGSSKCDMLLLVQVNSRLRPMPDRHQLWEVQLHA